MTIGAATKKKKKRGENLKVPSSNTYGVDTSASLAGPVRVPRHELSDQPGAKEMFIVKEKERKRGERWENNNEQYWFEVQYIHTTG